MLLFTLHKGSSLQSSLIVTWVLCTGFCAGKLALGWAGILCAVLVAEVCSSGSWSWGSSSLCTLLVVPCLQSCLPVCCSECRHVWQPTGKAPEAVHLPVQQRSMFPLVSYRPRGGAELPVGLCSLLISKGHGFFCWSLDCTGVIATAQFEFMLQISEEFTSDMEKSRLKINIRNNEFKYFNFPSVRLFWKQPN